MPAERRDLDIDIKCICVTFDKVTKAFDRKEDCNIAVFKGLQIHAILIV